MKTVLVVDDCLEVLSAVSLILDDAGYNVVCTLEPHRAVQLCREVNFDIVLCDLYMEFACDANIKTEMGGLDLIWRICGEFPTIPVIAMSGILGKHELNNLKHSAISEVLRKPFDRSELLHKISEVIDNNPKPLLAAVH